MWIMLIKKLHTIPSPPRMSIFWSTPYPDDIFSKEQKYRCQYCGGKITHEKYGSLLDKTLYCSCDDPVLLREDSVFSYDKFGKDHNYFGARRIIFGKKPIRVFPDEFSKVSPENMSLYVFGYGEERPIHTLVPGETSDDIAINRVIEGDDKMIYDAALIDGCNHAQAMATALGIDITIPDAEFPPIGWYRPSLYIMSIFNENWESEERYE